MPNDEGAALEGPFNEESTVPTPPAAWYYLIPPHSQSAGPVDAYILAEIAEKSELPGLLDMGMITVDTLVWAVGQESWVPLKENTELYSQVYHISSSGASVLPPQSQPQKAGEVQNAASVAAEMAAAVSNDRPRQRTVSAAKPAIMVKPTQVGNPMAEFQAEMEALEAEPNATDRPNENGDGVERIETPPPEDREFEDDDGTIYRWNPQLRKFQPKGEADRQPVTAPGYAVEDMTFETEEERIPLFRPPIEEEEEDDEEAGKAAAQDDNKVEQQPAAAAAQPSAEGESTSAPGKPGKRSKKRGAEEVFERIAEKKQKALAEAEAQKQWFDMKVNTSVYVTGLPDDITEAQLAERFSQYGVLKPGDDGAPRAKIYRDRTTQMPKGDGLVTFLYEPSVELACKLADEDYFRPGMAQKMAVQPAKFEMHGDQYVPKKKTNKKKNAKIKAKVAEKILGWGGFDDKVKPAEVTVILRNLFHPNEFLEEPTLLKDLESDIKEECSKLGQVEKVRVFAGNPSGIVSVKFKAREAAEKCILRMEGRFFGGRKVEASMWDGFTNFNVKLQETPEQEYARLERFAKEIEAQQVQADLVQEHKPPEPAYDSAARASST